MMYLTLPAGETIEGKGHFKNNSKIKLFKAGTQAECSKPTVVSPVRALKKTSSCFVVLTTFSL